ncbi:hypothetical protein [Mycobacterium sp. M26]|uniref:hypothetical protein n=1 Tax=Mycobacterium sp. M26 TaxID=1762962 RepID=UPI00073E6F8F|nr:hypothetical protein [Mycobacterium sp. M26]
MPDTDWLAVADALAVTDVRAAVATGLNDPVADAGLGVIALKVVASDVALASSADAVGSVSSSSVATAAVGLDTDVVMVAALRFLLAALLLAPAFCLAARADPPWLFDAEPPDDEEPESPVSAAAVHGQATTARPNPAANTEAVIREETVAGAMALLATVTKRVAVSVGTSLLSQEEFR